jgi:TRAP-type C4-dicarboxylate transport system substrate-binding protein
MSGSRWVYAAAGLLLIATGCTVDRAGGRADEEVAVLTFAQPNDGAPPPQLIEWAEEVGRLTDGSVEIAFENGWRIGEVDYETGTIEDVKAGEVDLAWVGARAFDRVGVTSFQALLAPLLVDSHDLQRAVFEEGIPEEMLAGVEKLDLVGVGALPGPMRKVLGVDAAFIDPNDFTGAVVGMQDSALAEETFRTLGATGKAVPSSAELDGLDGYEQQLGSITGNGYQARAKALTGNLNLWPRPLVIVAGRSVYDELTEEQQQALGDASRRVMVDALVGAKNEDEESAAILCDSSLTIKTVREDDLAAFRKALEPLYSSLREDPTNARFLDRIEKLKKSVDAGPDTAGCGGRNAASGAIPNGTYQHTLTAADVEKHCEPGDPTAAGFSGIPEEGWTIEMDVTGERIVQSQFPAGQPEMKVIGWTGTYRTYRDTLELVETGQSGGAAVTWSYEGKKLQLTDWPFEECDGVIVWASHPWVKVD